MTSWRQVLDPSPAPFNTHKLDDYYSPLSTIDLRIGSMQGSTDYSRQYLCRNLRPEKRSSPHCMYWDQEDAFPRINSHAQVSMDGPCQFPYLTKRNPRSGKRRVYGLSLEIGVFKSDLSLLTCDVRTSIIHPSGHDWQHLWNLLIKLPNGMLEGFLRFRSISFSRRICSFIFRFDSVKQARKRSFYPSGVAKKSNGNLMREWLTTHLMRYPDEHIIRCAPYAVKLITMRIFVHRPSVLTRPKFTNRFICSGIIVDNANIFSYNLRELHLLWFYPLRHENRR